MLDPEHEIFIIHIASLSAISISSTLLDIVYPSYRTQIPGLIAEKTPRKVLSKYVNFEDVFFPDLVSKLPKHVEINDHTIKLVNGQQPLYGPIYSLGPIELETLKAYIKTNLANKFIRPSKSLADTPILFDRKSDSSLQLCFNYQGLNNLMIKNQYPLPLIGELLNKLERVKQFIQLNLTSVYHQIRIRKENE